MGRSILSIKRSSDIHLSKLYKLYYRWDYQNGIHTSYEKCSKALTKYYEDFCGTYIAKLKKRRINSKHSAKDISVDKYIKATKSKPYDMTITVKYLDLDDLEDKWQAIVSFIYTVNGGLKNRLFIPCGSAYTNGDVLVCLFSVIWLCKIDDNTFCFSKPKAISQLNLSQIAKEGESKEKTLKKFLRAVLKKELKRGGMR